MLRLSRCAASASRLGSRTIPQVMKNRATGMGPGECLKVHIHVISLGLGRFDQTKFGDLKEVIVIDTVPL